MGLLTSMVALPAVVITAQTSLPMPLAMIALENAVDEQGFNLAAWVDLAASLRREGIERAPTMVGEVCHPGIASSVLSRDPRLSAFMPCRVSLYEIDGRTQAATALPSALLGLALGGPELQAEAQQVDQVMIAIIEALKEKGPLRPAEIEEAALRSFRQALVATGQGQAPLAHRHTPDALRRWRLFLESRPAADPKHEAILAGLVRADSLVASGRHAEAHEELEGVRSSVHAKRRAAGEDGAAEALHDFHEAMEAWFTGGSASGMAGPLSRIAEHASDEQAPLRQAAFSHGLQELESAAEAAQDAQPSPALIQRLKASYIHLYLRFG